MRNLHEKCHVIKVSRAFHILKSFSGPIGATKPCKSPLGRGVQVGSNEEY